MEIIIRYTNYKDERHPATYCRRLKVPEGVDISDLCRQIGVDSVVEFSCLPGPCRPVGSRTESNAICEGDGSLGGRLTQGLLKEGTTYTLSGFGDQRNARKRFERFEFQETR